MHFCVQPWLWDAWPVFGPKETARGSCLGPHKRRANPQPRLGGGMSPQEPRAGREQRAAVSTAPGSRAVINASKADMNAPFREGAPAGSAGRRAEVTAARRKRRPRGRRGRERRGAGAGEWRPGLP